MSAPLVEQRLRANVRLEASRTAAAALMAARHDARVAPLTRARRRAAIERAVREDGRSDTSAPEGHNGVSRSASRAEPHLRLSERLGSIFNEDRSADELVEFMLQRYVVPADQRGVHSGTARTMLDHSRHADTDAE